MNYSAILAFLAVSTFPASHGVLASSDRAAPESSTITATAATTTLLATTAKEAPSHGAAMQTQPGDVLDADVPKMIPSTAAAADADADAVTTNTKPTCKNNSKKWEM